MDSQTDKSVDILGVRVDRVTLDQSLDLVRGWVQGRKKHYIVTPNVEFMMLAQKDELFRQILNQADLAIPDSARVGWAQKMLKENSKLKRVLMIPFVLFPKLVSDFPIVSGVDLMEKLCEKSVDWGVTVGFLGGQDGVAVQCADCLKKRYPGLKVGIAEDGPRVDRNGLQTTDYRLQAKVADGQPTTIDLLFVGFGQGKQEKWIVQNLDILPIRIAMGVGGSFDELSGRLPRVPSWVHQLGVKWLMRLILQPWRIKRQIQLVNFVWKIVAA